jgi:uncharacterized protein (DUF302 family)
MTHDVRYAMRTVAIFLLAALVVLSIGPAAPTRAGEGTGVIEVASHKTFVETKAALVSGIKAAGFVVLSDIDHQMMLKMMNRDIAPAETFEYFRGDLGWPIFANDPRAALEIPLRILVITEGGKVVVRYHKAEALFAPYRGLGDLAKKLDGLTEQIVKQATQ